MKEIETELIIERSYRLKQMWRLINRTPSLTNDSCFKLTAKNKDDVELSRQKKQNTVLQH